MQNHKQITDKYVKRLQLENITIFLFHGVIKDNNFTIRNYTNKHIKYEFFCNLLKELNKVGNCISMDQVLYHLETKEKPPKNSYVITFDDGFDNNVTIAGPVLDDFKNKCIIYLTTNFIENNKMSWIDRIENIIEHNNDFVLKKSWLQKPLKISNKHDKINLLETIRSYVKNCKNINFDAFADDFCKNFQNNLIFDNDPIDKKLTWSQIKSLKDSEIFSFGGHSHNHPILSFLNKKELEFELDKSLELINTKGGFKTIHYSYPEGLSHCFNNKVINELKYRGIKCCPTAIDGINSLETDPFYLKRVFVN